ncbi:MAG: gamma-glutamyltransferase [Alphaproteobacteria bacterium]|nr:gamma-glutamyltransferase [Alphaproteobacteria bacterium]
MNGKRPTISSVHGIVAAAHPLAAAAGARILSQGGNAFDAAAATAAALNVTEPFMSGLSGLGMATCYIAKEQRIRCLDYITRVPSKFPVGLFKDREETARHPASAATPGNLAGWCELVRAYGRKSLAEVFAPAIALARDGFPIIEFNTDGINQAVDGLKPYSFYGDWLHNYTRGRGKMKMGDILKQPELAETLEAIAANGPGYLYGGPLGRKMVDHLAKIGGSFTMADLEAVQPRWQEPAKTNYRDMTVHTLPPPAESFQFLLTMRILDGFNLAAMERNGVEHLDTVWRAIRLAAGQRIAHNKPAPEKLASLLSDENIEAQRARVRDGKPIVGLTEQWLPTEPNPDREHTTSLSIADAEGNVICITQSLGGLFGCGVVIPGTGVCMNNFLYWGEITPGATNPLTPGVELAICTAPTVSTRADGKPVLALGTPGSYGICQTQAQAMVQFKDFGLGLQDAIEAPRARLWDGTRVQPEARFDPAVLEQLKARGHGIEDTPAWTMTVGGMQGIAINPDTGAKTGAADPRRDSYVATP